VALSLMGLWGCLGGRRAQSGCVVRQPAKPSTTDWADPLSTGEICDQPFIPSLRTCNWSRSMPESARSTLLTIVLVDDEFGRRLLKLKAQLEPLDSCARGG
jgi:hypothetical protein